MTIEEHKAMGLKLAECSLLLSQLTTGTESGLGQYRYPKGTRQFNALAKAHEALMTLRFALEEEVAQLIGINGGSWSDSCQAVQIYWPVEARR